MAEEKQREEKKEAIHSDLHHSLPPHRFLNTSKIYYLQLKVMSFQKNKTI